MSILFRSKKFIEYQWRSKTKYYLHSPFVYQFYLNVLEGVGDNTLIPVERLQNKVKGKRIVTPKYDKLLFKLVKYFHCSCILEFGTCIGMSTAYISTANPDAKIITLVESESILSATQQTLSALGVNNVELISGSPEDTLSHATCKLKNVDLIFFNRSLGKEETLKYFFQCVQHTNENSIFIFNDIYKNEEMFEAWQEIKQHPRITLTLDVFQFGICFFRKDKLGKENFVLRY